LDYGFATGSISFEIADKVKEVQGIDISSKMIKIASRKPVNAISAMFKSGSQPSLMRNSRKNY
jgi:predicted TPR repeat methyltransferase